MYAFVVNWNYKQEIPFCIKNMNYYGGRDCCFEMSPVDMKYVDVERKCTYSFYYETAGGSAANLLTGLLKQISVFQYNWLVLSASKVWRNEMQEYLNAPGKMDNEWYKFNVPENQENTGLYISKMNMENEIKPCFFAQEYKMTDDNGRPLYMVIMMEKTDNGTDAYYMYDFDIKFIGARQPLTGFVSRIPLCDAEELYQQKVQEYIDTHQEYYQNQKEVICQYLQDPDFRECFCDFHAFAPHGILCQKGRDSIEIFHNKYPRCDHKVKGKICHRYGCECYSHHHYNGHDGSEIQCLFTEAFGEKITKRVRDCRVSEKIVNLLPDVSNPEFIRKFNRFAEAEWGKKDLAHTINCFDRNGEIKSKKDSMYYAARRIQACAEKMNAQRIMPKQYA